MRDKYLGDSYDLVKRVLAETLRSVGQLRAHPRFVGASLRVQYAALTLIPVLDIQAPPAGGYGLFLDPHTGIPLPDESTTEATASHAPLPFIIDVSIQLRPTYILCFDQSYHRGHELTVGQQRTQKQVFLRERGLSSFYYVSHAPFLFMAPPGPILRTLRELLSDMGIPSDRLGTECVAG